MSSQTQGKKKKDTENTYNKPKKSTKKPARSKKK